MQRLTTPIILTALLIGLGTPGGALAQQASTGVGAAVHGAPARDELLLKGQEGGDVRRPPDADQPASLVVVASSSPIHQFQTRFDVVDVPEDFEQVLQIVVFPAGAWTPLHTPGGYVCLTVIDGAISTLLSSTGGVNEATYEAGDTFVAAPGEYMQVGNATAGNTPIMAPALLPSRAPLTMYQDGFTSSACPTLWDRNYTHDIVVPAPGPTTVYRSSIKPDRPDSAFELVQLVLELAPRGAPSASMLLNAVSNGWIPDRFAGYCHGE